ncbi:GLPGLI family protein [Riemerella columbina]|uniref:GLPGLI family protein n=1 Tax=Riemerella columbina TaxID=103810 RepID=UPI00266EAFEB|nr:GLPGLI family protein [Riemerella columbina]WKS94984.1 GLPGLI family protein [Riemerella columbina]
MKNQFAFILMLYTLLFSAQTYQFNYHFTFKEYPSNREYQDQAKVLTKLGSKGKLYEVSFGQDDEKYTPQVSENMVLPRSQYQYTLYTEDGTSFLIHDFIQKKYYDLEDHVHLDWHFTSETKMFQQVKLEKATVDFRGRHYTAWFQKSSTFSVAPWKFSGLPGIVYEIYDDENRFR